MIKCIAIDDEPLALAQIAGYISNVPFLHQVGACQDAFEAMQLIASEDVDLIFVDINMPDLNGLDFVRSLVAVLWWCLLRHTLNMQLKDSNLMRLITS